MKRLLIAITLAFVVLCFVQASKGSKGSKEGKYDELISELNQVVDQQLADRLSSLQLGMDLSEELYDSE